MLWAPRLTEQSARALNNSIGRRVGSCRPVSVNLLEELPKRSGRASGEGASSLSHTLLVPCWFSGRDWEHGGTEPGRCGSGPAALFGAQPDAR